VKQAWGDLTDDELIGRIKERTGQTREEIERRLNA